MIPVGISLASFGIPYAELRVAAQALDRLAFDSIWLWDHYISWNDPHEPVLECWTTLAGLAEATGRIRLGPLVANNTNRHPGRLAKVAATLQELSGGRLELGIGSGGWAAEQVAFGIDQGDRVERMARLAEALQMRYGKDSRQTGHCVRFARLFPSTHYTADSRCSGDACMPDRSGSSSGT